MEKDHLEMIHEVYSRCHAFQYYNQHFVSVFLSLLPVLQISWDVYRNEANEMMRGKEGP
jgi:hypothetical protein